MALAMVLLLAGPPLMAHTIPDIATSFVFRSHAPNALCSSCLDTVQYESADEYRKMRQLNHEIENGPVGLDLFALPDPGRDAMEQSVGDQGRQQEHNRIEDRPAKGGGGKHVSYDIFF